MPYERNYVIMEEKGKVYGMARCSTKRQDVEYEITELKKQGVPEENIFIEYISGKTELAKRVELDRLLKTVNPGDTIITTDITRIARNPKVFYEILEIVEEKKLCLKVGTLTADCRNDELDIMTSTMLQVMSIFANFDLKMKIFQIKLGLTNAVANGTKLGRPAVQTKEAIPAEFYKYFNMYLNKAITREECQRLVPCGHTTFYKYKKIIES